MNPDTFRSKVVPCALSINLPVEKIDENICRICLEGENSEKVLISPCKCSGSMKYVHEECLKIWILSLDKDLINVSCDVCKGLIEMEITLTTELSCNFLDSECLKIMIFPFIITIALTIIIIVIIYLVTNIYSGSLSTGEKIYLSIILLVSVVIFASISYKLILSIKACCCKKKIKNWRIKTICHETTINETLENINNIEESDSKGILDTFVVPIKTAFSGISVNRPVINHIPNFSLMINQEGVAYYSRSNTSRSITTRNMNQRMGETTPRLANK